MTFFLPDFPSEKFFWSFIMLLFSLFIPVFCAVLLYQIKLFKPCQVLPLYTHKHTHTYTHLNTHTYTQTHRQCIWVEYMKKWHQECLTPVMYKIKIKYWKSFITKLYDELSQLFYSFKVFKFFSFSFSFKVFKKYMITFSKLFDETLKKNTFISNFF